MSGSAAASSLVRFKLPADLRSISTPAFVVTLPDDSSASSSSEDDESLADVLVRCGIVVAAELPPSPPSPLSIPPSSSALLAISGMSTRSDILTERLRLPLSVLMALLSGTVDGSGIFYVNNEAIHEIMGTCHSGHTTYASIEALQLQINAATCILNQPNGILLAGIPNVLPVD